MIVLLALLAKAYPLFAIIFVLSGVAFGAYQYGRRKENDLWLDAINAAEIQVVKPAEFSMRLARAVTEIEL